jgi:predicted O-methyltransferase YrrM
MGSTSQVRYLNRVARAVATQPAESVERIREKLAEHHDRRAAWSPYMPTPHAEREVHAALGLSWPCPIRAEFAGVWRELIDELAGKGLAVGRGSFAGWDDGDEGLVRIAWCLARHLRPRVVVETGVARGLTSAALLRALARNGSGHLWSIDLPPLAEHELSQETGAAVTSRDAARWTLLCGSSRKLLPGLIRSLETVDLFVHDSMHTGRNVDFELRQVWPALAEGGAALVDDVHRNATFGTFAHEHREATSLVSRSDDGGALFGCLVKPGGDLRASAVPA